MFSEREEAIASKLFRRKEEDVRARAALKTACTQAMSTSHLYSASYMQEFARIQLELGAEDEMVAKPSRGEKLIPARRLAFERKDMKAVASIDANIKKRQNAQRAKRDRKKERKAALQAQMR